MDIAFALTNIHNELFQLRLQFLDRFLLFNTHGESELFCDSVDTANASRCGGVVGRHRSKASKKDHCCKKRQIGNFVSCKEEELGNNLVFPSCEG